MTLLVVGIAVFLGLRLLLTFSACATGLSGVAPIAPDRRRAAAAMRKISGFRPVFCAAKGLIYLS